MAYESVGNGYTVGVLPNIAAEDEQIQQGLAHKFDQYTNPFMLARGISGVFQPGIENAQKQQQINSSTSYQQGMLGVEQARQQLAATAQNTLLPLQANMLTGQSAELEARTAALNYQNSQATDAAAQLPYVLSNAATAQVKGDTVGVIKSFTPAVVARYPELVQNIMGYTDKNNTLAEQIHDQANQAAGSAWAEQNPDASLADAQNAWKPDTSPGITPLQNSLNQSAWTKGFGATQVAMQQKKAQYDQQTQIATLGAQKSLGVADIQALGRVARTDPGVIPLLESQAPGITQAITKGVPWTRDPSVLPMAPSIYPPEVLKPVISGLMALAKQGNSAYPDEVAQTNAMATAMMPDLAKRMGIDRLTDPAIVTSLRTVALQSVPYDNVIKNAAADPSLMQAPKDWLGRPTGEPSPFLDAVAKKALLDQQKQTILASVKPAPQSQSDATTSPQDQPWNANPYKKPIPAGAAPTPMVSGNPATTAAFAATGGAATPQSPAPVRPAAASALISGDISPAVLNKIDPSGEVQKAYEWAKANPSSPKAQQIMAKLKNIVSGTNGAQ